MIHRRWRWRKTKKESHFIITRRICWTINVIFPSHMASNSPYADLVDRPLFGETRSRVRKYETFLLRIGNSLFVILQDRISFMIITAVTTVFVLVIHLFSINACFLKFFLGNLCWYVSFQTHQWNSYFPEHLSYTPTWLAFMSGKSFGQVPTRSIYRFSIRHFGTDQVN